MPVDDDLRRPHATNKPHDHKSWDARRILLDGQLALVCTRTKYPYLCDDILRCVGNCELEGDEDS